MITIDYLLENNSHSHFHVYEIQILVDLIKFLDHLTMKIILYQQILLEDLFHKYILDKYFLDFQLILNLIHNFHKKFFLINFLDEKNLV